MIFDFFFKLELLLLDKDFLYFRILEVYIQILNVIIVNSNNFIIIRFLVIVQISRKFESR